MLEPKKPHVVIVGAGFGGLAAARALKGGNVRVTLIDKGNHHLFQPLLYQVATAALSPADIAAPSRSLLNDIPEMTVVMAEVEGIDSAKCAVKLSNGQAVHYDYLVVATGATYSYFGRDEWRDKTQTLKTLGDALAIREKLLYAFEAAEKSHDPALVRKLLTFVVIGGGPTGVEMAGAIAELARTMLARDFKHLDPGVTRIVLCQAMDRILPSFAPKLSVYALRALAELGVETKLGAPVAEIDGQGVLIGEERIETANVLWCAGVQAHPVARWLGVAPGPSGSVKVDGHCAVPGCENIFVIGDAAYYRCADETVLPGLAPVAKQQGRYVGKLIKSRVAGVKSNAPFRYRNLGTMAVIGRFHAVADFRLFSLSGFPAWLAWSLVHILLLIDFRSRLMVSVNWLWSWCTKGRGARLLIGRKASPELVSSGRT